MMWFDNLKLGKKLLLAFGVLSILTIFIGIMAISGFAKLKSSQQEMYAKNIEPLSAVVDLTAAFQQTRVALRDIALAKDPSDQQKYADQIKVHRKTIDTALGKIESSSVAAKELAQQTQEALGKFFGIIDPFLVLALQGKSDEAAVLTRQPENVAIIKNAGMMIKKLAETKIELANKNVQENIALSGSALNLTAVLLGASLIFAFILGGLISRRISAPLHQAIGYATKLSKGDLSVAIRVDRSDETGQLQQALKTMGDNLKDMIAEMVISSEQVSASANQLHATSQGMANSAEMVAEQANTVATAGEEMAATSADIARNCSLAVDGVDMASRSAQAGASVVNSTVQVMAQISDRVKASAANIESLGNRSDQIGEIVGTIEDIADQTNLLALNAAIEAARAGEQGRGFAVVADEVRALAERTTRATKEIAEMIKAIQKETKDAVSTMEEGVKKVASGSSEAAQSGQALKEIMDQVGAVVMQVNQIATAAEEQTCTTSQISGNMQQITDVMHETVRGARETAQAADNLRGLAGTLKNAAARFRLAS
jgi:methyl-accepting chemotaxis protein